MCVSDWDAVHQHLPALLLHQLLDSPPLSTLISPEPFPPSPAGRRGGSTSVLAKSRGVLVPFAGPATAVSNGERHGVHMYSARTDSAPRIPCRATAGLCDTPCSTSARRATPYWHASLAPAQPRAREEIYAPHTPQRRAGSRRAARLPEFRVSACVPKPQSDVAQLPACALPRAPRARAAPPRPPASPSLHCV